MGLKFTPSKYNTKLRKLALLTGQKVYSISLPPGDTCPGSKICRCKIKRGKLIQLGLVRCYSAQLCLIYRNSYKLYKKNYKTLKDWFQKYSIEEVVNRIIHSIPPDAELIRWNCSGDFFSYKYLCVIAEVARRLPYITIYAHTKSVAFVVRYFKFHKSLPPNFSLSLSYGSTQDKLIPELCTKYGLKSSVIVKNEKEGKKLGLKEDRNDSCCALKSGRSFFLPIHGIQHHKLNQQLKKGDLKHAISSLPKV